MKTFRQIPCSDRLPEKRSIYLTDKGESYWGGAWLKTAVYNDRSPEYWLEEIQLPIEKDVEKAINDIKTYQQIHIDWAEYFESNPEIEKKYVSTGEWDTAKTHREICDSYDNVLNILSKLK